MKKVNKDADVLPLRQSSSEKSVKDLAAEIKELKQKQKSVCEQAVRSILQALDCKDHYTFGHSLRVTHFALKLGEEMGFDDETLYDLEMSALFHDIGKIAVPDAVLLKPARLDDEEFLQMKQHPSKSAEILEGFEPFEEVAKNAKHHHERYDGRGYPDGLKGEEIPLFSRIILIADTFDAMTSTRPYRKGLPYEVAFAELEEFAGSQFDPELVKNFVKAMTKDRAEKSDTFSLKIIEGQFKKDAA
ncbi:MAG: hypothetical protein CME70_09360 [Halobacteriovorax sp.]|nr:hypothetical protein [Halobacteriovorax sp.]|tara:strand:+ start:197597 stop:198331 length:735 start_codon:yes stop_codon:yes gene_type:complete